MTLGKTSQRFAILYERSRTDLNSAERFITKLSKINFPDSFSFPKRVKDCVELFAVRQASGKLFFETFFFASQCQARRPFPCQRGGKIVVDFDGHNPFTTVFLKKSLLTLRVTFILPFSRNFYLFSLSKLFRTEQSSPFSFDAARFSSV